MSEGLFPNHPRSGDWETLKGRTLSPHMTTPMTSTASKNLVFFVVYRTS